MKISVIIPAYNAENTIEKCIESVENQTYQDFEIILIDDGSKDKTKDICEKLSQKNKKIKFYSKSNSGVASTRNYGIYKSSSDFLFFLDSDDYLDSNVLEILANNSNEDTICTVTIKSTSGNDTSKNSFDSKYEEYESEFYVKQILKSKIQGFSCGYLISRKKLLDFEIRFDDTIRYIEDMPFIIEVLLKYKKVKVFNNCYYYYFINFQSLVNEPGRLMNNIINIDNSIKKISEILIKNNKDYFIKYLNAKKMLLIKKEIFKNYREPDLLDIINNKTISQILKEMKISSFSNFIFYRYIIKSKSRIEIYVNARNKIKKILKRGK